jgi:Tannase and feruloyl esterase
VNHRLKLLSGCTLLACLTIIAAPAFAQQSCEKLKELKFADATISSAETVAAGALSLPPAPSIGAPSNPADAPAFCRVKGILQPSSDSNIGFEVWMPAAEWNGRFAQLGNGGLAGSINLPPMLTEVMHGFATAATDDGHQGSGIDGSWALGHPEKVKDFGYRAVHETSEKAKAIIAAFYGHPAKFSYFKGCSEGGREALMEAQRYPTDFNGILAGSTAHYWTQLMAAFVWNAQALNDPASFIPEPKRKTIEDAALAACGKQYGVTDTFIKDPPRCGFDPATLLCKGADSDSCLTAPQLKAIQSIYSGPKNPRTGQQISFGYEPGAEAEPGFPGLSFASYVFGAGPGMSLNAMFTTSFYGAFVFNDPKWKFSDLNFDKDIATTDAKLADILNASSPDLAAFKAHRGKILHYHGWNDGSPPPRHSTEYYSKVVAKMGGLPKTEDFYKLYMVPGMMHCGTGPGPNSFGNFTDPAPADDADHNIFIALENWVEKGIQPGTLIATKYNDDDPKKGVAMTRPLCAYPRQAKWNGKGATSEAANWSCELPPAEKSRKPPAR